MAIKKFLRGHEFAKWSLIRANSHARYVIPYVKFSAIYRREGENTARLLLIYYNKSNIQHASASLGEPVDTHTAPVFA